MPTTAYLLTDADGASTIATCDRDLGADRLLEIENRNRPAPFVEARHLAFAVAEVGLSKSSFSTLVPSAFYEGRENALDEGVVREALGKFSDTMVDDEFDMRPWRSVDAAGRSVLVLVPAILEERDVVNCLKSLGQDTAELHRTSGSYPVIELEAFGVPAAYVPEATAPKP